MPVLATLANYKYNNIMRSLRRSQDGEHGSDLKGCLENDGRAPPERQRRREPHHFEGKCSNCRGAEASQGPTANERPRPVIYGNL